MSRTSMKKTLSEKDTISMRGKRRVIEKREKNLRTEILREGRDQQGERFNKWGRGRVKNYKERKVASCMKERVWRAMIGSG